MIVLIVNIFILIVSDRTI